MNIYVYRTIIKNSIKNEFAAGTEPENTCKGKFLLNSSIRYFWKLNIQVNMLLSESHIHSKFKNELSFGIMNFVSIFDTDIFSI